jgi:hypothetical protein
VVWNLGYKQGTTGSSIGKSIMKFKVVSETGQPIGFGLSVLRQIAHGHSPARQAGLGFPGGHTVDVHRRDTARPARHRRMGGAGASRRLVVNGSANDIAEVAIDPPVNARAARRRVGLHLLRMSVSRPDSLIEALRARKSLR